MGLGRWRELGQLVAQSAVDLIELLAASAGPVLIAIFGQELAAVGIEGRPIGGCSAQLARRRRGLHEAHEIDLDRIVPAERDQLLMQLQATAPVDPDRVEGATGGVDRLVQIVARGVRVALRPEQLGCLLGVKAPLGRQRQQLDQALRLAQPPSAVGDRVTAPGDGERPEEVDAQHLIAHPCALSSWGVHEWSKYSALGGRGA